MPPLKKVHVHDRREWRRWLAANGRREKDGILLVFSKKGAGGSTLTYDESVEEALCYGWIDSTIRSIDAATYSRVFTPRHGDSNWSDTNKRRVAKLAKEGRMTRIGMALVEAAKRSGRWDRDGEPGIGSEPPPALAAALEGDGKARAFFESLAPTYRRQYIVWNAMAKRSETIARRVKESMNLLAQGKKLGLK